MAKNFDLIELNIAEDLKELVKREVGKLMAKGSRGMEMEKTDFIALEKLTRAYTLLMADLRETVKAGFFEALPEEALEGLSNEKPQEKSARGRGRPKKVQ